MIPWEILGRARAPEGGELVLYRRGGEFVIRVGGRELMSSRAHGSEEELAALACRDLPPGARVLVGGLGLGYTLRATLDRLPADGRVAVAEIVPAVIEWNRGPLAALAGRPLDDPRVTVEAADVGQLVRRGPRWDAILLDVDNGPVALTRKGNHGLYSQPGLMAARAALRPRGVLAVWSAAPDRRFVGRLRKAGFSAEAVDVPARGVGGGPMHTIFVGRG
jgi:spermidine synthase